MQPRDWTPCPNCGRTNPPSALVCSRCGRYFNTGRLSRISPPASVVSCAHCGSSNYDYRERCWKCLYPLPQIERAPTPASNIPDLPAAPPQDLISPPIGSEAPGSHDAAVGGTESTAAPAAPAPAAPDPLILAEIQSLTETIDAGRGDSETFQLRAGYLVELGRFEEAEADLEHVADPLQRDLIQADIAAARGNVQEACDLYESVLATDPSRSGTARKLARLRVRLGSFNPEDVEFVRQVLDSQFDRLASSNDWVQWVTYLHERYSASDQWEKELDLLQRVSERNPVATNPRLGLWMVEAMLASGQLQEAVGLTADLPVESGKEAAVLAARRVARALIREGQNARALQLLHRIASADTEAMARMLANAPDGQRFVPLERIGAGAVAEVWRAFDLHNGEDVGLKILHESLAGDPVALEELRKEYEVMSGGLSPRLARAIPGTFSGDRFAMELLEGSLAQRLLEPPNAGGLPLSRCVAVAQQISEGLEYLHARGLVYQDLSPQNILFKGDDVKLSDLGGIKEGAVSAGDVTVAKVAYASPEQCSLLMGETGMVIDRRSDIYSLGIILYQMATGRLPFEGPDQAVLHAHLYANPVAPMIHRPGIGRELNQVILRCMSRDPEARPPTASALWQDLAAIRAEN